MRETIDESVADGAPVILRFANCELDVARVTLRRDGREVKLEPQAFDVLCYLVEHRGEVVRKEQLLDDVWGDRFVSESALTTRIKSVRQAVGDDGSRQAIIRTVHGKGLRVHRHRGDARAARSRTRGASATGRTDAPRRDANAHRPRVAPRAPRRSPPGAPPHHPRRSGGGRQNVGGLGAGAPHRRPLPRRGEAGRARSRRRRGRHTRGRRDGDRRPLPAWQLHWGRNHRDAAAAMFTRRARQLRAPRRAGGVPRRPNRPGGAGRLHRGDLPRAARAPR